jgi:DASS family divalent anion:Na+ symporter
MFEKIVSMFRYFKSAVPFRVVPALIATLVLTGLLLTPVPAGWTARHGNWWPSF